MLGRALLCLFENGLDDFEFGYDKDFSAGLLGATRVDGYEYIHLLESDDIEQVLDVLGLCSGVFVVNVLVGFSLSEWVSDSNNLHAIGVRVYGETVDAHAHLCDIGTLIVIVFGTDHPIDLDLELLLTAWGSE